MYFLFPFPLRQQQQQCVRQRRRGKVLDILPYLFGQRRTQWLPGRFVTFIRPLVFELSNGRLHSRYPWTGGNKGGHATITRFNGFSIVTFLCCTPDKEKTKEENKKVCKLNFFFYYSIYIIFPFRFWLNEIFNRCIKTFFFSSFPFLY